jgi:hypothetical protein
LTIKQERQHSRTSLHERGFRLSTKNETSPNKALAHAQQCIEICHANSADPIETFFGYEAVALIEKARGNSAELAKAVGLAQECFEKVSADDKKWCEKYLTAIKA